MQAVADTSARSLSTGFRHSQATRAGVHAANQEALYRMSESDDSKYVQSAEGAAVFVRPKEGACHFVTLYMHAITTFLPESPCICMLQHNISGYQ